MTLEVTFGFIKPDAYEKRREIKDMILGTGLDIVLEKDPYFFFEKLARELYEPIHDKPWYEDAVKLAMSGPTVQLLMTGEDAIKRLSDIVGDKDPRKALPNTIRGKYGKQLPYNAFHRSDSKLNVVREVLLNFSEEEIPGYISKILNSYRE
jgi:nucleoside-diphosphate kinase